MSSEIHNWGKDIYSYPAIIATPESVEKFRAAMQKYDPEQRMLNAYFRERLFDN